MSEGEMELPSALRPWHEEQPFRKISFPSDIALVRSSAVITEAVVAPATWKVVPIPRKAKIKSRGATMRCRRYFEILFIFFPLYLIK
jgi:hypothetical protein